MLKKFLFLTLLSVICISCSSAKASDSNVGGNQDDQNNPPAPSVPEVSYASQGLMIMDNPSTGFVEVYRSADGKIWEGPATAYNSALPLLKNIEGTLEQYIVIDNSSMLVSTTYGIFFE